MRYDFPMILPALSRMVSARLLAVWDRLYSRWKAWLWGIETGGGDSCVSGPRVGLDAAQR